jgi:hypothetical protein
MRPRSLLRPHETPPLTETLEESPGEYDRLCEALRDALDELELPSDCEETVKIRLTEPG